MENTSKSKNLAQYFTYINSELAAQNTYLATSRLTLAIAIIAGVTKRTTILIYALTTCVLSYIQYYYLSDYLKDVLKNQGKEETLKEIFKLNSYNKHIFLIYSIFGIGVIIFEFYVNKNK